VAVKIRLKRMGKIRAPFYRVVVMDSRAKRDGRAIEEIGKYHPTEEPSLIDIDSERAQYWLGQGAQPTEAVAALLKVTGDWQKYKGEPGTEGTLKVKAAKPSKKELYEAAIAAAGKSDAGSDSATTPKKKAAKKADEAPAEEPKAEEPKAEEKPAAKESAKPAAKPARRGRRDAPERVVVRAHAKYVRTSARKARLVCDHIRGKDVGEARAILLHTNRQVAEAWSKLLESAVANAAENHSLDGEDLRVAFISADEGPTLKRFRPRAMGRATKIRKRTSHLSIGLEPKE
jgi:small subunit ribosomal protein S16